MSYEFELPLRSNKARSSLTQHTNPAATQHDIAIVQDDGLTGRNGALRAGELDMDMAGLTWRDARIDRRGVRADLGLAVERLVQPRAADV